MPGLVSLGQAYVRAADRMFTRRSAMGTPFAEQGEEVLNDVELTYAASVELEGRLGPMVRVEFVALGPRAESAILTLSSGDAWHAHGAANEILR